MGNLENHIKQTEQQVLKTVKRIKKDITMLKDLVVSQSLNYDLLKEQFKTKTYNVASVILEEHPIVLKKRHQMYNNLRSRNVIDKAFAEDMELIQKPLKKKTKGRTIIKSNNNVMRVAEMMSKLRSSELSSNESNIIKDLFEQMVDEL